MQESSSLATSVGAERFGSDVIEASERVPVLVDFWAPWCAPCRMLAPILAGLAREYAGKMVLVKVNTDEEPELARAHDIRALPTVKLFRHGAVVEEFYGVQTESTIREILERHLERASDRLLAQAHEARASGDGARALALLRQAHEQDPRNHRVHPELARMLLEAEEPEEAQQVLGTLPPDERETPEIRALAARAHIVREARDAPPIPTLEQTLAGNPGDCEARYRLGMRHAARGDYEAAMEQLFEVMRRDRGFRDDAGRRGLLAVFDVLGGHGALVARYRSLMASALH